MTFLDSSQKLDPMKDRRREGSPEMQGVAEEIEEEPPGGGGERLLAMMGCCLEKDSIFPCALMGES